MWDGSKGKGGSWGLIISSLLNHRFLLPNPLPLCSGLACSRDLPVQATISASPSPSEPLRRTGALWLISQGWAFDSRPAWQPSSAKFALSPQCSCFINTAQNQKNQPEWELQRHSSPKMWYLITGGFCGGIVYNPKFKSFLNFRRSSTKILLGFFKVCNLFIIFKKLSGPFFLQK